MEGTEISALSIQFSFHKLISNLIKTPFSKKYDLTIKVMLVFIDIRTLETSCQNL